MIIDANTRFSNAQAITAAAGSTNIVDLGAIRNLGVGEPQLFVVAQVTTAFTDAGDNSSVVVYLQTDDNATPSSATNTQTLGTFATNSAVGTQLVVPIAPGNANERYLRLYYDVAGGNLTTGAITAFVTPDPQLYTAYAKGYTGPTFQ